ncbi:hypothetical protein RO3G_06748 [Rhizopus delemar RA 99-880]|uniref:TOG domain-containing protein n=1 Tax=Rhizopus delemar (strain RA 99-880 / ATCC MYA-4621 / FGSC 9543 / NRRL 43880) TaxID=246409 RepID=I1C0R3_RHIO9|nr:hypothetical protein RO3G_06748 [Rhizopus delemar RA 99-880]|eukprot:EIE82043.1 hypothetical protein RO3G_06748 [Rhizopus delemar RA 99-880]
MDVYIGSLKECLVPETSDDMMIEFTRLGLNVFNQNDIALRYNDNFDDNSSLSLSTQSETDNHQNVPKQEYMIETELFQWANILMAAEEEAMKYINQPKYINILEEIKQVKLSAEALLNQADIRITSDGQLLTLEPRKRLSITPKIPEEEEEHEGSAMITQSNSNSSKQSSEEWSVLEEEDDDEFVMLDSIKQSPDIDPESIPEPIMEEEREPFQLAIQVFGEDTVACILSIKSKCRGRGLGQLEQRIDEAIHHGNDYNPEDYINASLMLIQEAVMDSREPIVALAISIWHQLIDFCEQVEVEIELIIEWVERTFCGLLKRTSDSQERIRRDATSLILLLVQVYSTPPYTLVPLYIGKPDRLIHHYKEAKSRIELVEITVRKLGRKEDIVSVDDVMQFVVAYLRHSHEEVREAAVKLLITVSNQVGFSSVSSYIDESLKLSLADTVKKLVNKGSFNTKNDTKKTISEINAFNNSTRLIKRSDKPATKSSARKTSPRKATTNNRSKLSKDVKEQDPMTDNEDNVCIFCDEMNPLFNEDTLIKHYYKECPVLTTCPSCKMITEISTLNEHMLHDCEKSNLIKECTRCHQAILIEHWLQHTLKQTCPSKYSYFSIGFINNTL